ncbi:hypothetical protein Plim_4222 [Planctopirus limnophila DSM 3776]|uniref:Uncharacterized protein n=1 Tax=Planctopirus limnophila (strain ATCC 43296 / DSM 3776 / IFAM 1008 / Mu 290) TaxID=521674 RepID=D5SZC9_PLAL2|nr:hypothetical protein [Planctopirus limnophila]ADG70030.1 hypothetical protein Plim_4222 [Planctopirus limnophila DSM 3776]
MPQNVAQDMQTRLGSKGPKNLKLDILSQSEINQYDMQFHEASRKVTGRDIEILISELSFLSIGTCSFTVMSVISQPTRCILDKLFRFVWISTIVLKYTDIIGNVTSKTTPLYGVSTNF